MEEFTIIVVGGGGVGKTCITCRMTEGGYHEDYNPTIEETYVKEITIDSQPIKLTIIDTAGQEEYAVLRDNYWRTGDGFLLVFDLSNRNSFDSLPEFYDAIVKAKEFEPLPIVLCANKSDLPKSEWKTREDELVKITKEHSWTHFYTSAKTCENVQESFDELVRRIIKFKRIVGTEDDNDNNGDILEHELNSNGGHRRSSSSDNDNNKNKKKGFLKSLFGRKK